MSDFKFSCPECGQNISCDTTAAGMAIACPACQKALTIPNPPSPPPPSSTSTPSTQPGSPPRPQPGYRPLPTIPESLITGKSEPAKPAQTAGGYSKLAIASLICSVWAVLGFIPGIICGRRAKEEFRRQPSLKGERFATAGLAISYAMTGVTILSALVFSGMAFYYRPVQVSRESPAEIAKLKTRIVDEVTAGDSSEWEHSLSGKGQRIDTAGGQRRRLATRGGWFGYTMDVLPDKPMTLNCRYWGGDQRKDVFDIAVEGQIVGSQKFNTGKSGHFFDVEYKIPISLTRGKRQAIIEFHSRQRNSAGGIVACQILKP